MAHPEDLLEWHESAVLGVVDDAISCAIRVSSERSKKRVAAAFAVRWAVAQVAKTAELLHVAPISAARPAAAGPEALPSGVDRLAVGQTSLKAETISHKPAPARVPEPVLEPTLAQPESPCAVFTVTPDSSLQRSASEKAILAELSRLEEEKVKARQWEEAPPEIDKSIQADCVTKARRRPSSSASPVGWRVASAARPSTALPKIRKKSTSVFDDHLFQEADLDDVPPTPVPKATDLHAGVIIRTSDGRKVVRPGDVKEDRVCTAAPPPTPPPDRRTPLAARPSRRRRPKTAGLLWCWGLDGHKYLKPRVDIDWQVLMFTAEPDLLPAPLRIDLSSSCGNEEL